MGLFRYFFCRKQQKEFFTEKQALYKEIRTNKAELNSLIVEQEKLQQKFKKLKDLITRNSYSVTHYSFHKTDKGVDVIVLVESNKREITIRIFDEEDFSYRKIWLQSVLVDDESIHIHDIQGGDSKGHGSLLLQKLFELAKEKGIKRITGSLVYVDLSSHKERLIHFYKKNGGTIKMFKDKHGTEEGKVYWEFD